MTTVESIDAMSGRLHSIDISTESSVRLPKMKKVVLIGGPPLYLEAVSAQLLAQSIEIAPNNDATELEVADAILLYCETEADWDRLSALSSHHLVAVLPDFNLDGLVRALAAGASPTHLRTSSEIIVATAQAAAVGEAMLPMGLAQNLAL